MKDNLNTIYIISKGRPQCKTAQTLIDIQYTGEWFIVCGTNDERLGEYQKNWGGRVLVFDWKEEVKESDLLDNFGVEKMGSGAVPVRNATRKIAFERGEKRHWQFDDDYTGFYTVLRIGDDYKHIRIGGADFYKYLSVISEFADSANLGNAGFAVSAEFRPDKIFSIRRRVFNAHNMPTDAEKFTVWRGRMNDDLINAIENWRRGNVEITLTFMMMTMRDTQSERGGNTEIYQESGTVRKTAYSVMIEPKNAKLVHKFGRFHHEINWRGVVPRLISENHKKQ